MMNEKIHRTARIARALQIRLDAIEAEMEAALQQREAAYQRASALLDVFDELAEQRFAFTRKLWKLEQELSEAAFDRKGRRIAA